MTIQSDQLDRLIQETDERFAVELIEIFLNEFPKQFGQLKVSCGLHDPRGVVFHAHTLKGSSRQFGLEDLAQMFQELEQMGQLNSLDGADTLVFYAGELFLEAKKLLTNFLNSVLIPQAA